VNLENSHNDNLMMSASFFVHPGDNEKQVANSLVCGWVAELCHLFVCIPKVTEVRDPYVGAKQGHQQCI
jgi:hypothetical protein